MARSGKILVIRGGAIGDFILTLPVLKALRTMFPSAGVEVLCSHRVGDLAVASGHADDFRPLEARGLAPFFAPNGQLDADWRMYFNRFAVVISYLFDYDGTFQSNVLKSGAMQFIQGIHRPSDTATNHASDQLLKTLEAVAIFDADGSPELRFEETSASGKKAGQEAVVALHPGSGSESKNWPLNRWLILAEALAADPRIRILLVGGEADQKRLQAITRVLPADRTTQLFQQPLTQVARELQSASLFVGHDSGISHLAAAIGLRGILLWGPTNEVVWRPRSERFDVIRHPAGIAAIQPDVVHAAIVRRLSAD